MGAEVAGREVAGTAETVTGVGAGIVILDEVVVALVFAGADSFCEAEGAGCDSLAVDAERAVVVLDEGVGSGAACTLVDGQGEVRKQRGKRSQSGCPLAAAKAQGVTFQPADILILRVGFIQRYHGATQEERNGLPGKPETL